jgi:hypothetical protein
MNFLLLMMPLPQRRARDAVSLSAFAKSGIPRRPPHNFLLSPKPIRIPGNDDKGVRYHPGRGAVEGESPKSALRRLSTCAYRKAASKKAQAPSSKFTMIPFSI